MKLFKKTISIITLVIMLTFSLVACNSSDDPNTAKGFQWKVTKGSDEMYLIGTIHIADSKYNYINKNIQDFIKKSDGLAVEVDITEPDTITASLEFSYLPVGETIENHLTPEEIEKLKSLCTKLQIPYEAAKMFKPATIISLIELTYLKEAGSTAEGVDSQLLYKFKDDKKEVISLETAESQFKLLDEFQNIDALKKLLNEYNQEKFDEDSKKTTEEAKQLVNAYINGDEDYMLKQVENSKKEDESYYNKLVKERNVNMANGIDELFKKDGTHTVAVGALHYFGEDSIIKLLEDKGYKIVKLK